MTRYSRSVIPGRPTEGARSEADDNDNLDRVIFGSKKKPVTLPANDADRDYPDPMQMDVDEAGFLVDRSDSNRRTKGDRRKTTERRKEDGRRRSDYAPLREGGGPRVADDGKRGPILLVGALVIVAVFGVVVWNAYREGVRTDDPDADTPQLAAAGAFKTPPRETADATAAVIPPAEPVEQLDGDILPTANETPDARPDPTAAAAAVVPAPAPAQSKFTAPAPVPLKAPVTMPVPTPKPAVPATSTAIVLPKPAVVPVPPPVTPAALPASPPAAYKPAFAAGGSYVVQIAAPSTEASAIAEWDRRAKALPEFFSAAERYIVQADVNGKTVYRLRAGTFASKADADAFCSAYKAKGGNCFPAAK